jgi:hypothetical protein
MDSYLQPGRLAKTQSGHRLVAFRACQAARFPLRRADMSCRFRRDFSSAESPAAQRDGGGV